MAFIGSEHFEGSRAELENFGERKWNLNGWFNDFPSTVKRRTLVAVFDVMECSVLESFHLECPNLWQQAVRPSMAAFFRSKSGWQAKFMGLRNLGPAHCPALKFSPAMAMAKLPCAASSHSQLHQLLCFEKGADSIDKVTYASVICCMVDLHPRGLLEENEAGLPGRKALVRLVGNGCSLALHKRGCSVTILESSYRELLEGDNISVLAFVRVSGCSWAYVGWTTAENHSASRLGNVDNTTSAVPTRSVMQEVLFAGGRPSEIRTLVGQTSFSYHSKLSTSVADFNLAREEKVNRSISTHLHPLGHNIQASRWNSFQKEFDPQQIPCLCRFSKSFEVLELVFLHTEGMASLIGVGISFSTVIIQPQSNNPLKIRQMSENSWRNLWMDSNSEKYVPVIFEEFSKKGTKPAHYSNTPEFSRTETLSQIGMTVDENNHSTELKVNAKMHSNGAMSVAAGWRSLLLIFSQLAEKMEKDSIPENKLRKEHLLFSNGEYTRDTPRASSDLKDLKGKTALKPEESSRGHTDRAREGYDAESSETFQTYRTELGSGAVEVDHHGEIGSDKLTFVVNLDPLSCELDKTRPSDLPECYILPEMTLEFQNPSEPSEPFSKRLKVTLKVAFQLDAELPRNHSYDKFGWYHDSVKLSLECCKDSCNATVTDHKIKFANERTWERTEGTEASRSSSREGQKSVRRSIGITKYVRCFAEGERVRGAGEQEGLRVTDQKKITQSGLCLEKAPAFVVRDRSYLHNLVYEASLRNTPDSHKIWDNDQGQIRQNWATPGIFGTFDIEVEGTWNLVGGGINKYEFAAEKELNQLKKVTSSAANSNAELADNQTSSAANSNEEPADNQTSSAANSNEEPADNQTSSNPRPSRLPQKILEILSCTSKHTDQTSLQSSQSNVVENKLKQTLKWPFTLNHGFPQSRLTKIWALQSSPSSPLPDFIANGLRRTDSIPPSLDRV